MHNFKNILVAARIPFLVVFAVLFFACSSFLLAQGGGKEDVVYTKNGWVIRGKVLELETSGKVRIQTTDGNIFTFSMEEVEKITQEPTFQQAGNSGHRTLHTKKNFSYYNATQAGLLIGSEPFFSVSTVNGIYINPRLSVGIGIAYQKMNWNVKLLPIYLEARSELLKNRPVSPYVEAASGYAGAWLNNEPWQGDFKGGWMGKGGFGLKFNTSYELAYTLSLHYQHDRATEIQDFGGFSTKTEMRFNRIGLMVGLTF